MSFYTLVDEIKKLSLEEKEQLQFLIQEYLIEERREMFYQSLQKSQSEEKARMLRFSSDIKALKQMIDEA